MTPTLSALLTLPDAAALDHVTIAELHGLGTLRPQLTGNDHLFKWKRNAPVFESEERQLQVHA